MKRERFISSIAIDKSGSSRRERIEKEAEELASTLDLPAVFPPFLRELSFAAEDSARRERSRLREPRAGNR